MIFKAVKNGVNPCKYLLYRYLHKVFHNSLICELETFFSEKRILSDVNIISFDTLFMLI